MFWDHWKTNTSLGAFLCDVNCTADSAQQAKQSASRLKVNESVTGRGRVVRIVHFNIAFNKSFSSFICTAIIFSCESENIVILGVFISRPCAFHPCRWRWITRLPREQDPTRRWPSGTRPRRCSCSWDTRPPQSLRTPPRFLLYFCCLHQLVYFIASLYTCLPLCSFILVPDYCQCRKFLTSLKQFVCTVQYVESSSGQNV